MQEENKILYFLKKIWPTTYRIINTIFYFLINLIRSMVLRAIDQIRNF